jgi:hypothetical protein
MNYNINTVEGSGTNAWKYWVNNIPSGQLILSASLNFIDEPGIITLNTGTSFNGNGYTLNFLNVETTSIQLFNLQGGLVSNLNIVIGNNKGIITINNFIDTIDSLSIDNDMYINGNLTIKKELNLLGNIISNLVITNTSQSISELSGALVSNGGMGIIGNLNVSGNVNFKGNLLQNGNLYEIYWKKTDNNIYNITNSNEIIQFFQTGQYLSIIRLDIITVSVGKYALFTGGSSNSQRYIIDAWNSETNIWSTYYLPEPIAEFGITSIGNYVFFAGGSIDGIVRDTVYILNIKKNIWTTEYLYVPRNYLSGISVGKYALFAGGKAMNGVVLDIVDIWDSETKNWLPSITLPNARYNMITTSIGNYALFIGGNNQYDQSTNIVDILDIETKSWLPSITLSLNTNHVVTSVGKYTLFSNTKISSQIDIWNSETNILTSSSLPESISYKRATSIGKYAIFVSDIVDGGTNKIDIWNSETGVWTRSYLINNKAIFFIVSVGKYMLVTGDISNINNAKNVEIYYDVSNKYVGIGTNNPNANLDVAGNIAISGITRLTNANDANSISEGAFIIEGGMLVNKNVNIDGNLNIDSNLNVKNIAQFEKDLNLSNVAINGGLNLYGITLVSNTIKNDSLYGNNGAVVINGGVGIGGNTTVDGTIRVRGNLIVGDSSLIFTENSITNTSGNIIIDSNIVLTNPIQYPIKLSDNIINTDNLITILDRQQGTALWAANISGSSYDIGYSICSDNLGGIYVTGEFASSTVTFYHANGVVGNTKIHSGGGDCFITKYNNSGTVQWAANISSSGEDIGSRICSDNLGGIYITGNFSSNVTFYHANGVVGNTKIHSGGADCFIAKYNNSGTVQWAANISGTNGYDVGTGVCSDNSGGIYITGYFFSSTVTFYHANGVVGATKINSGDFDCFIAKYNNSGTVQWVANIGGGLADVGIGICSDNSGGIYVTGSFTSSTVTFYHANGVVGTTKTNSNFYDCFIAKYNNSGTVQWAANISGSGDDYGRSICSDNLGGIYVTGSFISGTVTFYHANGVVGNTKRNSGSNDCFIAKYNNSGTVQWAANISGSGDDYGFDICSDNLGGIYVTGYFSSGLVTFYHANGVVGNTKIHSGGGDCFIAKYNSSGTVQWATNIAGSGEDIGYSICSDNLGGIYVTGSFFSNPIIFFNANGVVGNTKINAGSNDCFIACYQDSYFLPNLTINDNGTTLKTINLSGGITNLINSNTQTIIQPNQVVEYIWYNNRWLTL